MTLANVVVIEVMRGRNLDATCTEFGVDIIVRNNRNASPDDRQNDLLADQVFVAFVIGMHGNSAVAEHGFGPRRSNDEMSIA